MFKSEEQVNKRLNSDRNLANRFGKVTDPGPTGPAQPPQNLPTNSEPEKQSKPENVTTTTLQQPGNKLGKKKLGLHQKNEIAIRSRLGETQPSLAQEFGVSQATIGAIERGRTKVNEEIVERQIDDAADLAMSKLLTSLGYIDNAKLSVLDPVKLSVVARNMSGIVNSIRQKDDNGPQVVVQIYAPELKKESSYKSLDV
jgi:DNA-binding XRE family transcriptional regulator